MDTIADILKKFDPVEDKYISREFQSFGVHLAEKLEDSRHKSLYIKMAKTMPRAVLEEALRFVVDSKAKNKGALFMWKLKELGVVGQGKKKAKKTEDTPLFDMPAVKKPEPAWRKEFKKMQSVKK